LNLPKWWIIRAATGNRPYKNLSDQGGYSMKELLKNMIYTGVGAAFLTREKLEELRKDLVEKGNMTKEEGREFIDELLKKSDSAKDHLEQWLNRNVKERIKKCNFASADEVAELRRKVDELQVALNKEKNCQKSGDDE
jgi:polyhydroxyalkanoate synthesis regulator phasin